MNRNFLPQDVRRLLSDYHYMMDMLTTVPMRMDEIKEEIEHGARQMVNEEVIEILKGIDIDELNRDKKGIRVKALREHQRNQ